MAKIEAWIRKQGLHLEKTENLTQAFTHPSTQIKGNPCYERLEFLGDRVLGLAIAEMIYHTFPEESEGDLARRFSSLVNRVTLMEVAETSGLSMFLEDVIQMAPPSQRRKETILSDTCEAFLGALYLEGGVALAHIFIKAHWTPLLHQAKTASKDAKSALQEYLQKQGALPSYKILESSGPSHDPVLTIEISVPGQPSIQVKASSRRTGEQKAAEEMLKVLRHDY